MSLKSYIYNIIDLHYNEDLPVYIDRDKFYDSLATQLLIFFKNQKSVGIGRSSVWLGSFFLIPVVSNSVDTGASSLLDYLEGNEFNVDIPLDIWDQI